MGLLALYSENGLPNDNIGPIFDIAKIFALLGVHCGPEFSMESCSLLTIGLTDGHIIDDKYQPNAARPSVLLTVGSPIF